MFQRGRTLTTHFLQKIDDTASAIINIPLPEKIIPIYCIFCSLIPSILLSFFDGIIFFATPITVYLLYKTKLFIHTKLSKFNSNEMYWYVSIPYFAVFTGWGLMLSLFGNPIQTIRLLGMMGILTAICIWPAFIGKKERDKNSFDILFFVVSNTLIFQQFIFWIGAK